MTENLVTYNHEFAEAIGKDFGATDNKVQAKLLTGFLHGVNVGCKFNPENQFAYIVDEIPTRELRHLVALGEMAAHELADRT